MKDFLNRAIDLHKKHMDNPKTATPQSQKILMQLLDKHEQEMRKRPKKK